MLPPEQARAFVVMLLGGAIVTTGAQLAERLALLLLRIGRAHTELEGSHPADILLGPLLAGYATLASCTLHVSVWRGYLLAACALGMTAALALFHQADGIGRRIFKKRKPKSSENGIGRQETDEL